LNRVCIAVVFPQKKYRQQQTGIYPVFKIVLKLLDAVFPVILVLLFFAYFRRKDLKRGPALRFLIVLVSVITVSRTFLCLSGIKFAGRYFYDLVILSLCFAAPGVYCLADIFKQLINRKYPSFSKRHALGLVLLIAASVCLGKALHFHLNSKRWVFDTAETVKANLGPNETAILVSNNPDRRAAYYADAYFIKFIDSEDALFEETKDGLKRIPSAFGTLARVGTRQNTGHMVRISNSHGLKNLRSSLEALPGKVFVLMRMPDKEFRRKFEEASVPFPFKLIRTMHDVKKREICLYVLKEK
jgi:hypothetical protein